MKTICVSIEDELHKQLKMETVMREKSVKQYITELIKQDLESKKEQTR